MTTRIDSNSRLISTDRESDTTIKESRNVEDTEETEDVILEEIDDNRFKLTVPKNVSPGDEIEINNGQGKKKVVRIKEDIHAGDILVVDFNDRKTKSPMKTTTTLAKPSITSAFGTVVRKMVGCGCTGDVE